MDTKMLTALFVASLVATIAGAEYMPTSAIQKQVAGIWALSNMKPGDETPIGRFSSKTSALYHQEP